MLNKLLAAALSVVVAVGLTPLPAHAAQIQASPSVISAQAITEAETALGLFKDIRDKSEKDTPAYIDAQCAIDILTGTVSDDVDYPIAQGPSQSATTTATDGSSNAEAYKAVDFTNVNDAVSLYNLKKSVGWIGTYNDYRAKENAAEHTSLATDVGTNCRMMAISIVQCDWSKSTIAHSRAFDVGENLSWGYSNPFDGWYTEEKALFKAGKEDEAGHYLNIVDYHYPTSVTGFATCSNNGRYGLCCEQSFYTLSYYPPNITYSTEEFSKLISAYEVEHDIHYDLPSDKNRNKSSVGSADKRLLTPSISLGKTSKAVSAKAAKKKAQSFKVGAKTNSKGKISYTVTKTNKQLSFKGGKLTLKKGAKKGTYSMKVKVSVAQKGDYAAASKEFKLTFSVK